MAFPLKPDFGKDEGLFPPLPQISSPVIKQQVFTHRSVFARPTHVFEDTLDDPSPDNEKYEHLGDTVLGLAITNLLIDLFPGLRVGPSTKIRAMVVGNPTLAEISLRYKLPDHLRLHPAQAITLRASTNVQADVFEAFVGGLYLDQGLQAARTWINKLFTPYAIAAYQITRQQHGLQPLALPSPLQLGKPLSLISPGDAQTSMKLGAAGAHAAPEPNELFGMPTVGHLALFNQHLQKSNMSVEWVYDDTMNAANGTNGGANAKHAAYADMGIPAEVMMKGTKATPVWYVKVLVDGAFYGRGRGNTKKAARNEAAKEGLDKLGIKY